MVIDHQDLVRRFIAAIVAGDLDALGAALAHDLIAHITVADASTRTSRGRAAYVDSIAAMDVGSANLSIEIPQVTTVSEGLVLVMVEVHAARNRRTLHNFSGQLVRFAGAEIAEIWMVEALPAESDAFWSA